MTFHLAIISCWATNTGNKQDYIKFIYFYLKGILKTTGETEGKIHLLDHSPGGRNNQS